MCAKKQIPKKHKYNASKVVVDDINFDSKFEAFCYNLLKTQKFNFSTQPEFIIQPKFKDHEKTILPIKYKADFLIKTNNYEYILDSKGFVTPEFKLKKKLLLYQGHRIICVYSQIDMYNFIEALKQNIEPYDAEKHVLTEKKNRKKTKTK